MRLRIVHCDPEQTERVRAWFREHPGHELFRDTRHVMWHLPDGEQEIVGYTWAEQLDQKDGVIADQPEPPDILV
jgi:hypothetical protein